MAQDRDMCWAVANWTDLPQDENMCLAVVNWTDMAQDRDMCWAVVNLVVKIWVPSADSFLTS